MLSSPAAPELLSRFPGPVTLHPLRKKWLLVLAGCALFAIGGYWMVRGNEGMGWLVLIFFGLGALIAAAMMLGAADCNRGPRQGRLTAVRIGYFANLTHAQAVLGVASGDFARAVAPVGLRTQVFNAGPSLIEALLAGEIDHRVMNSLQLGSAMLRLEGKVAGDAASRHLDAAASRVEAVARVHGEVFGDVRPANTLVVVRSLVPADALVEIEADVVISSQ